MHLIETKKVKSNQSKWVRLIFKGAQARRDNKFRLIKNGLTPNLKVYAG